MEWILLLIFLGWLFNDDTRSKPTNEQVDVLMGGSDGE